MKKLITHIVKAARKSYELDCNLRELGYGDTPYWSIHCELSDALYELLGENTESYDKSFTYAALSDDNLTDEQRILILMTAYRKNRPAQS